MIIEMRKRTYTLRRRAERQDETRERILEAAVALHQKVGPGSTTVSAIAERAGVQRLTVYRHFPDEARLLRACTAHWLARNPPPGAAAWAGAAGAGRLRAALAALYAYYRRTAGMWHSSYRDVEQVPGLRRPMGEVLEYLEDVRADILRGWPGAGRAARGLIGHALRFSTWESLAAEGFADDAMAARMARAVEAAAR